MHSFPPLKRLQSSWASFHSTLGPEAVSFSSMCLHPSVNGPDSGKKVLYIRPVWLPGVASLPRTCCLCTSYYCTLSPPSASLFFLTLLNKQIKYYKNIKGKKKSPVTILRFSASILVEITPLAASCKFNLFILPLHYCSIAIDSFSRFLGAFSFFLSLSLFFSHFLSSVLTLVPFSFFSFYSSPGSLTPILSTRSHPRMSAADS